MQVQVYIIYAYTFCKNAVLISNDPYIIKPTQTT